MKKQQKKLYEMPTTAIVEMGPCVPLCISNDGYGEPISDDDPGGWRAPNQE